MTITLKIADIRETLRKNRHIDGIRLVDISGEGCIIHPCSPAGWQRIICVDIVAKTQFVIYHMRNNITNQIPTARLSASTYLRHNRLEAIPNNQDLFFASRDDDLKFDEGD